MKCTLCQKDFEPRDLMPPGSIRQEIIALIHQEHPRWNPGDPLCREDHDRYRMAYITHMVQEEQGSIATLEKTVLDSISQNELLSLSTLTEADKPTFGERVADQVALFGGSWRFIIFFFLFIAMWIAINAYVLLSRPFDPYPFILLNLILSCLAAIQAPIIMMSQNRQEAKDRQRSLHDYKINLKAEIEVRTLHEKVDHMLLDQWSKMMEIQDLQLEILGEIRHLLQKDDPDPNTPS